ncbi:MAG: ATP-binding domain-containing protein, partial [Clostridia bacterium]|nr:ATP-binding domain-containing protein [Clostridia bacterium]
VFRQAMESLIITNAHAIVAGEMPDLSRNDKDFFFINRQQPSQACETVCELCSERLVKAYNYSAFDDIQVLCPSKKGETGTGNINKLLQEKLNPPAKGRKERLFGTRTFRVGDKLMQTKNNYNIEWRSDERAGQGVFNGDIGILEDIDENEMLLKIRFDDRLADIPFECSADLDFAYAVTVHKSQGSEFNAVVIPVTGISPYLEYRNLLYTAVTRAKELIVLVGRPETVSAMVKNNKKQSRYSALKYFIMLGDES